MLERITSRYGAGEKLMAEVNKAEAMVKRYGWEEKTVMPYSWPEKVTKLLRQCKQYFDCTSGSRDYLIQLWNGLAPILNKWEETELEPKVLIRILSGKKAGTIKEVPQSFAKDFIEDGYAEIA